MAAPATTDAFLDLVRKSGLIEEPQLDPYIDGLQTEPDQPPQPRVLARRLVRDGLLTQFQAEQLLLGKYKPFVLNSKYKLLERIGAGGMGFVYLCEHIGLRKRVAVKVLPTEHMEKPTVLDRFYREARAAAALDHPNIVRAHDIDRDGRMHFLVMDYVDGRSFQEIVSARGPLPIERAAHYIAQAALGLQHAHECGLVHRDIKPANLLLDRAGTVKILDLGLARFFDDESDQLTRQQDSKSVLGTADYVAPEQALDSHGADIRADIYSLGFTFYFLLTGFPPFHNAKSIGMKLLHHQKEEPRSIEEIRPEVPAELAAVLRKMMAKNPAERYATPADVIDALEPWTQELVDPPSPEEMPQMCLAATRAGESTITSRSGSSFLMSGKLRRSGSQHRVVTPPVPAAWTAGRIAVWALAALLLVALGAGGALLLTGSRGTAADAPAAKTARQ